MEKAEYQRAVEILRSIQIRYGTTENSEADDDTFEQTRKLLLSLGHRAEEDVDRSEKHYRQEFLKHPLLTEYENRYCNWILNDMLDILYKTSEHIKSGENGVILDFEKPVIGSVDFGFYNAFAMNEDGAKVVLISRSLLTSTVFLASIVAQSSTNQIQKLPNEYTDQYFVDMAVAYHINSDISSLARRCPLTDWTACMMGEIISATSHLFIVAHEYAHLILSHPMGYNNNEGEKRQYEYEQDADELAGLLCGIVIKIMKNNGFPFSFTGLAFAVRALDLFHDILSVLNESEWDPNINEHPLNRRNVAPDVMQRFQFRDKKEIEIILFMLGDMNRIWEGNKDKVKYFVNKHRDGANYEEIQKQIYE